MNDYYKRKVIMSKYKCIVWGTGIEYDLYINSIRYHELLGNVEILGVTSNQSIYQYLDGYKFISTDELLTLEFDLLIVASLSSFNTIKRDAISIGINEDKIINIKIFGLANLDINKYVQIKKSKLSIFSNNCWGGLTYNRLGLEFLSPFINMFESTTDYLKIINNPKEYLNFELEFARYNFDEKLKIQYPVFYLNDVILHFNHYTSTEHAVSKWRSRKNKISWDNIFVMMYTTNEEEVNKFIELPYKKKVCFVPFETSEESLINIHYKNNDELNNKPFWEIVNGLATGDYKYYDVFDLLLGSNNNSRIKLN